MNSTSWCVMSEITATNPSVHFISTSKSELPTGGLKRCSRCTQYYYGEENNDNACRYHPKGYNRDVKYEVHGWLCCRNFAHNAPGCTVHGKHLEDVTTTEILASMPIREKEALPPRPVPEPKEPATPPPLKEEVEDDKFVKKSDGSVYYKHKILNTDTLTSLAVKYSCKPQQLKKANNIFGRDDEIHTKKYLLIPWDAKKVSNPQLEKDEKGGKLVKLLQFQKNFHISKEEATFYLEDANWDLEAAEKQLKDDLKFESKHKKKTTYYFKIINFWFLL